MSIYGAGEMMEVSTFGRVRSENVLITSEAFYSAIVSSWCSGGMFVPSHDDLWHLLDPPLLNELWIIGMREFLLRRIKYYMVTTFDLITGQNVSSSRHHLRPIHLEEAVSSP